MTHEPKRHLHRDYHRAYCGKDASHILMAYEPGETTCAACLKAKAKTSVPIAPVPGGGGGE